MEFTEHSAGPNQTIVVYQLTDDGTEIDPDSAFAGVAADAEARAAAGWHIVSTSVIPLRHSAVAFGRDGSGFETKACIAVVYAR